MKKRIQNLVDLLNQYRKEYYTDDKPTVSDSEYDVLYRELVDLEKAHPEWILPNSPTQEVGGLILEGFDVKNWTTLTAVSNQNFQMPLTWLS